jgi:16S rRNA (guanine527-N7)-methyltransferase
MRKVGSESDVVERFHVSRESYERLKLYERLLRQWQRRINLIGGKTLEDLWHRHIADGLQLDPLIGPEAQTIIDLGSGAGIPGLVLALFRAGRDETVLVERNHKKAAFLSEVARQARIPVKIVRAAIEDIDSEPYRRAKPVIVARALAPLPKLLELATPLMGEGRGFFHKGQRLEQELTEAAKSWKIRYNRHPSATDSAASILEVLEAKRIDGHP